MDDDPEVIKATGDAEVAQLEAWAKLDPGAQIMNVILKWGFRFVSTTLLVGLAALALLVIFLPDVARSWLTRCVG